MDMMAMRRVRTFDRPWRIAGISRMGPVGVKEGMDYPEGDRAEG